jgi:S-adenosylmethionine hydrolase
VIVAVVDPGVGSSRRAIAVESEGFRFVAPDNGLIELSLRRRSARTIVEIANRAYTRPVISRTFEGRDRFAPAAAWLASGIPLRDIGPPVGAMVAVDLPEPATSERAIDGVVLIGDRFGNLVTNIARGALERIGTDVTVHIGAAVIERVSSTYADFAPGSLGALIGSTERLEIAVNGGSAGDVLALGRGAPVQVRRR